MAITQTISTIPEAGHRGIDTRNYFVTKQEAFQDALTDIFVTEINTFRTQANTLETNVNAKEASAVSASQTAQTARDEAILARDEAAGAAATLPDGIINDAIISTTDTWSSDKISKQTMVSKPTITSPTNGAIDFISAITATYATSPTYTGAQNYVRWECSTSPLFGTLVDSYEGASNLLSWTPSIGMALTVVYVRVKQGSDNHISEWSNTVSFTTPNIYVQTPTMTVTGTPSDVTATPTLTTSAFSVYNGTDTHASTDWIVTKVSDGTTVWASMGNTTNKTSITMPSGILVVSTAYVFSARHNGATYGGSAFVQVSGTTKSAFTVSGNEIAKIVATDKAASDYFGQSVSLSSDGTTLAVGANKADPSGVADAGACYIYKYNGSSWVETKVTASDKAANDSFGYSVSLSSDGTTLAVGAYLADPSGVSNAGACYIYKYNGTSWVANKIPASDKVANDAFGYSVSLSSDGTTLAVGAYLADPSGITNAGACYVYKYNGTSWVETKIVASDKATNDQFGYSVSLSSDGTTLAVGAYTADPSGVSDAGACYVYKYNGTSWVETKITASDKAASDRFGQSVYLSSDGATLAVGAIYADPSGLTNAGACYIYKYNGSSWVETKVTASDKAANDSFGQSVSLSSDGTTLAVGAVNADPSGVSDAGACYVYK